MAKRGIRIRATGKHRPVKPKLSSGRGGILTHKIAVIVNKQKDGKVNT